MPADTLSHEQHSPSASTSGFRCNAVDSLRHSSAAIHAVCRDDAALVIGLALAHARQGRGGRGGVAAVPGAIFDRLVALADQGEPSCRMVYTWLERQTGAEGC